MKLNWLWCRRTLVAARCLPRFMFLYFPACLICTTRLKAASMYRARIKLLAFPNLAQFCWILLLFCAISFRRIFRLQLLRNSNIGQREWLHKIYQKCLQHLWYNGTVWYNESFRSFAQWTVSTSPHRVDEGKRFISRSFDLLCAKSAWNHLDSRWDWTH